ncbi:aldehyde dehydrogenase [Paenibacillus sacheonensis]|uniref:Aldehyde dehydrogenase n=1 Tax=Paenibacillus sacheonensis TaxID=742054 RepID=A0A7X5BY84_9BACL|nr:aldehyde dehydrogenase [Paenibacillus sacheonensis]MBM7567614.1 lactaldehyde dehydrogenase/glycolaldehyde dehydrogenase [Paenibacillus sacheonensis]NBC71283.1 aldehyde dehydrogenase [Paenibacillus sacheonensis]
MSNETRFANFIGGAFVDSTASGTIDVINPSTGEIISRIPDSTVEETRHAIDAAESAQAAWAKRPAIERAGYLRKIAQKIRDNADRLAHTIAEEQGKIMGLATVEANFTADYIDYMAEWARRYEGEIIQSDRPNEHIFMFKMPIGVVGGILPWNFPFFLIARKMAPALLTGNTIVIKPSEETPNNCYEFAKLVAETDLPPGVFNVVFGRGATVGQEISANAKIGMISFTGSVDTGSRIMAAAARNITKVSLELGGKAPAIVMNDANLDLAARSIRDSRIINSGQVCNCAERVYVQRKAADEFIGKLAAEMSSVHYGNPLADLTVDMGPLINEQGYRKVESLVAGALQAGAQVVTGGKRADRGSGFYFEPTVLTGVKQDFEIMHKEIFGPVLPVVVFDDLDEAVAMANDSEYGLTSSIYTQNLDIAMRACREIKFGETYVNRENFEAMQGFHAGWRKSGIGGADGKHGLEEYLQTRMVYIQYDLGKQ